MNQPTATCPDCGNLIPLMRVNITITNNSEETHEVARRAFMCGHCRNWWVELITEGQDPYGQPIIVEQGDERL